jgi:hypothetical protein
MHQGSYLTFAIIANMRYGWRREGVALPLLIVIVVGTAYETAVALGWIPLGDVPGEGPRLHGIVRLASMLAMLTGAVLSWVLAAKGRITISASLLAVAGAAFAVAAYYTFDPYYLPTLRRYSDDDSFPAVWVYSIALAALVASLLCLMRSRFGLLLTGPVLLLCVFTSFFLGVGH